MFARSVSLHLKPNRVEEFTHIIENEVIPLLRKQKGFQDEDHLGCPGGIDSDRDQLLGSERECGSLQSHNLSRSRRRPWRKCVEGTPQVQTHEVSNSTFHKIAARVAA